MREQVAHHGPGERSVDSHRLPVRAHHPRHNISLGVSPRLGAAYVWRGCLGCYGSGVGSVKEVDGYIEVRFSDQVGGKREGSEKMYRWLAEPHAKVHLYGKAHVRQGRKMGHVTCVSPDPAMHR